MSRSTVELAYEQLLSEGYIESEPCKGFFAAQLEGLYQFAELNMVSKAGEKTEKKKYRYDFSPRGIDLSSFPYNVWRKLSKEILVDDRTDLFRLGNSCFRELKRSSRITPPIFTISNQDGFSLIQRHIRTKLHNSQ